METFHKSGDGSEGDTAVGETVEIKIKTLDSQSYTLRVEKNVPVPLLKEQLAPVVGVPADNQRLICRGKVLKDDQILSAYNVEDGHTLHLVARQPPPAAGVGSSTVNAEGGPADLALPPARNRSGHISHSVLMGTINIPDTGEGNLPDINRIIAAVFNSVGMAGVQGASGNPNTVTMGVLPTPSLDGSGVNEGRAATGEQDTGVRELELQIDALYNVPSNSGGATGTAPFRVIQTPVVVPDALATMSQYLDRLEQSFSAQESARLQSAQEQAPIEARAGTDPRPAGDGVRRVASPTALGALVNRVNNLLRGQASSALAHLAGQLESEPTLHDAAARDNVQHTAFHDGNMMQQIGALLLELGRATLSLRMGQSPSDSVVNAGPAIFISPTGPNPMMVQGANVASFRQVFDLSGIHRQNIVSDGKTDKEMELQLGPEKSLIFQSLPVQTAAGVSLGTGLPTPPGTLGPSPDALGAPRSIHIQIHTSDVGASSASPSPSLSSSSRQLSSEELARLAAGVPGLTVRQLLERVDQRSASQATSVPQEIGVIVRPNAETPEGASASVGITPNPAGVQGTFMTFDEHGAMRVVPVRSRTASGHVHAHIPSNPSNSFDPLLARFQHQFIARPASTTPHTTTGPVIPHPVTSSSAELPRPLDVAARSLPGEGGVPGNVDVANLVTSLGPFLQQIAGALQQAGPPVPPEQQSNVHPQTQSQQPSTTETEVRQGDHAHASTQAVRAFAEPAAETGVANMETDDMTGHNEGAPTTAPHTSQVENLEANDNGGTSGEDQTAPIAAPVGLGLGGLQPLPARARRRRQVQHPSEDERQAGQNVLQNLLAQRDQTIDSSDQRRDISQMPAIGTLLRAVSGGDNRQQAGPNIIGQLMRSPVMETLVQQVMQGVGDVEVGGARRGPATGGLPGIFQQMMPVVSQMLGGGGSPSLRPRSSPGTSTRPPTSGAARDVGGQPSGLEKWQDALSQEEVAGWSETIATDEELQRSMPPQRPFSDVYTRGTHAAKRQKTEMEVTAQKLENGESAEEVLQNMADSLLADAAGAEVSGSNVTSSGGDVANQVVRTEGLAEAYLLLLFNDLAARVAADPDFGDGSRFPHAARVFLQPPPTFPQPDGE